MIHKWLLFAVAGMGAGVSLSLATAQEASNLIKAGYVTEVHGPNEFALNKLIVTTSDATAYRFMDKKAETSGDMAQRAAQVGAYLQVQGTRDEKSHALRASLVLVRDDWEKKLSGFGVIEKMSTEGATTIIDADGYRIRITPAADLSYGERLSSLAGVKANSWIHYEGVRDAHGELVAEKAKFIQAKFSALWGPVPNSAGKKTQYQMPVPAGGALMDADGKMVGLKTKVRYGDAGGMCGWHKVSTDAALQERVLRIGTQVVPAYQKALAEDDPAKVPFRFYAVEEEKISSELVCVRGLILVPRKVAEKLESDDQLAALLADGVAFNLQVQSIELRNQLLKIAPVEIAAVGAFPPLAVAELFAPDPFLTGVNKKLAEQRARMALHLMAAAGYDPWQAPEAWRLLAEKKPPKASQPLVYPDRSGYQLSILNLQYGESKAAAKPAGF